MEVESAFAGAARGFQNGIRPQGPAVKRLLIVLQDELDETPQRNVHLVCKRNVAVETGVAGVDILSRCIADDAAEGRGHDIKSRLAQR